MASRNAEEANAAVAAEKEGKNAMNTESTPASKDSRTTAKTFIPEIKNWAQEGKSNNSVDFFDLSNPLDTDETADLLPTSAVNRRGSYIAQSRSSTLTLFQPAMNRKLRAQLRNGKPILKGRKSRRKRCIFARKLNRFNLAVKVAKDTDHINDLISELFNLFVPVSDASKNQTVLEEDYSHEDIMIERKKEDMIRRQQEETKKAIAARELKMTVIKELTTIGFEFVDFSDLHYRADDELEYEVGRRSVSGNTDRFTLLFRKP